MSRGRSGNYNSPEMKEYIKKKYHDPFGTKSNHKYMEFREQIFKERDYRCDLCRKENRVKEARILDHLIPVMNGGSVTDRSNIQILCKEHEYSKTREDNINRKVELGLSKKKYLEKTCIHGNITQTIHREIIPCPECIEEI